jgi:hypothetical protein
MWVQFISSMNVVLFQWIYWILFKSYSMWPVNSFKIQWKHLMNKRRIPYNEFCLRKRPKPIRNLWIFWEHFKKLEVWEN